LQARPQREHAPSTDDALWWVAVFEAGGLDVANTDDSDKPENLRTAYAELCTSYHAIDDFRAKLLGFLPLVTGGGLILLTGRADAVRKEFFWPVGLFGIAVTAGLLAYELFGIKKCHALLMAGEDLEKEMKLPVGQEVWLPAGQFIRRPNNLLGIVNEPFAAAAIYPAVLAAWTYLALFFDHRHWGKVISPTVFVAGFAGILLYDLSLRKPGLLRNRVVNPVVRWLLHSPLHPLLSGSLLILAYEGCKTGRWHSPPCMYARDGLDLYIVPAQPDRKVWWRNLRQPARVRLRVQGHDLEGIATASSEPQTVAAGLRRYLERYPKAAKRLGVRLDASGIPHYTHTAARPLVVVAVHLDRP
jgi:hypothetical protein